MHRTVVIDTNVILVANGQHSEVSPQCVANCALELEAVMKRGRIALDDAYEILTEYQNKTKPQTGNRPGDAFVKWVLRNNANTRKCDLETLRRHSSRGYEAFPDDEDLRNFDPADRKFVALSAAHIDHPPILQAADSKWVDWAPSLKHHQIEVDFLCEEDIRIFHRKKSKGSSGP